MNLKMCLNKCLPLDDIAKKRDNNVIQAPITSVYFVVRTSRISLAQIQQEERCVARTVRASDQTHAFPLPSPNCASRAL